MLSKQINTLKPMMYASDAVSNDCAVDALRAPLGALSVRHLIPDVCVQPYIAANLRIIYANDVERQARSAAVDFDQAVYVE